MSKMKPETLEEIFNLVEEHGIEKTAEHRGCKASTIVRCLARYKALENADDEVVVENVKVKKVVRDKPRLVFSDVHAPFNHPNYLQFLKDTHKKYGCKEEVICLGDLIDHHAISRHQSETDSDGAYTELDRAIEEIAKYVEVFPKCILTLGNHDRIPVRQCAFLGIGERFVKSLSELVGLPSTWRVVIAEVVDGVFCTHGIGCGGKDGAINTAIVERRSVAIGHYHAFGGCKYSANRDSIIFGLNTGCGVDHEAYAFAYGKHSKFKETMGCGIIYNENHAVFVPMGAEYLRSNY